MTLESLNMVAAPLHRHFNDVSWTKRKRSKSKGVLDDDYFAGCLIALAGSGGATSYSTVIPTPTASVDTKMQTKLSSSTAQLSSYNSTLCGKSFSSRRALGRHRSKPPTAAADYRKPPNSTSAASGCASRSSRIFKCSICGKIFPKGQALGGHMRKHFHGVVSGKCGRKNRVNSSDGGNDSTDGTSFSDGVVSNYSDGNSASDMAPAPRNLELKLPLRPSPYLDLTLKLY